MSEVALLAKLPPYTTTKGEKFEIEVQKKLLTASHTYWLYIVNARHEEWGLMEFHVFATKQAFAQETLADQLALGRGVAGVQQLLEEAKKSGRPLYFPIMSEGWLLM